MLDHSPGENSTCRRFLENFAVLGVVPGAVTSLLSKAGAKPPLWDNRFQLTIDFELAQPDASHHVNPYVAIWIEDQDTFAVRTLCLWVQETTKDACWISHLKRWWRDESERRVLNGGDLTQTISSSTRRPDQYSLVWNGRDDEGKLVEQGDYTLCIEVAREHGSYQIMKMSLPVGTKSFQKALDGNGEVKGVRAEFKRK